MTPPENQLPRECTSLEEAVELQAFGQLALVELEHDLVVQASGDAASLAEAQPLRAGDRVRDSLGASLREMVFATGQRLGPSPLCLGRFRPAAGEELVLVAQAPDPEGLVILEALPAPKVQAVESVLSTLRWSRGQLATAADQDELLQRATKEVKRFSAFDRVLVHRLLPDGSEVILAEARSERLPSMLDHRHPAGRLSAALRAKLKIDGHRFIPDIDYKPRQLLGAPLHPEKIPDLGRCLLQGVPRLCINTLRRAGVQASLSLSIMVDGELWGLITCHNTRPVSPDYTLLEKCRHLIDSLGEQLGQREKQEIETLRHRVNTASSRLLGRLVNEGLPEESLLSAGPELLDILPADGVAIVCGNKIAAQGATPERGELRRLAHCVRPMLIPRDGLFMTDCLASHFARAKSYAEQASGLLAIRVSPEPHTMLLWFRREEAQTLQWQEPDESACFLTGPTALPTPGVENDVSVARWKSRPWSELVVRKASFLQERAGFIFQQRHIEALNKRLREANRQLSQLAETDPLTGLANRRIFDERLALEWGRSQRDCRGLSLILIDVDFFKRYNDRYGHPAGDRCLVEIAEVLKASARRASDLAVRLGGEEFALLLPGTGGEGAEKIAETLRQDVLTLQLEHVDNPLGLVSISLGVASTRPHCSTAETRSHLVKTADVALYEAKGNGRNRVCVREM